MTTVAPDALAVSCGEEHCLAPVGLGCLRPDGTGRDPHPSRVVAARSAAKRTPAQTAGYIVTLTQVRRGLEDLLHAAERNPQLVADQLAAIRNCPHAIAAMGRALAHGEKEGGSTGPNRGQTAQDHAEHAMAHAAVAYARPEERDAVTGELDATHAMARWALFVEVSR